MKHHSYHISVHWTGNTGSGTSGYTSYQRDHVISAAHKPDIPGSSDSHFRGNAARYNPEEMLVASLSACHMLWYLHLCAEAGVIVTDYQDLAVGKMIEDQDGGRFQEVCLRPQVTVKEEHMRVAAEKLHHKAHELCFIANSVNFPVRHQPAVKASDRQG